MHRCGPDRSRVLPILIAFVSLFATAGCAATGRMPEALSFAPAGIDAVVTDNESGQHRVPPAAEAVEPVAPTAAVDQAPSVRLVAVSEEPRLPQVAEPGTNPLLIRASGPRAELGGRLAGVSPATDAVRRHVETLQFARGSASLAREEYIILQAVAALRARKGGRIAVVGHADRGGAHGLAGRRVNRLIAERRAATVADALVALGLPRAAVTAEGRGDREPRYAETNAAGAAGNRRAEIYLLPAENQPAAAQAESESATDAPVPADGDAVSDGVALERGSAEPSVPEPEQAAVDDTAVAASEAAPAAETTTAAADGDQPRRIPIATLYFGHASSRLGERERAIIEAAAVFQRQYQGTIVIVGHASAAGGLRPDAERLERANRALSLARADAVARRLAAFGVTAESLSVVGKGADEPAFVEDDAAGEAGNRRVEIYVDLPTAVRLADRGQGLPR